MTRYGEEFELDQKLMDDIAVYMDDEKREKCMMSLHRARQKNF